MAAGKQFCKNLQVVQYLVQNGVDVNQKGYRRQTALHRAMSYKPDECGLPFIKVLVENGADVNARMVDGDTVLSEAIYWQKPTFAEYLRANGAV